MRAISRNSSGICTAGVLLALIACASAAHAFTVNIAPATPKAIYLQVGVGTFTGGNYNAGGTPGSNTTINTVSVTVPAAAVGSGTAQTMTTNSASGTSLYDGFLFCNLPNQLYIGGFYRQTGANTGAATATVTSTSPANLVNAGGNTIPFNRISWISSGNGDTGGQPFPAGTFVGGTQTIGTISRNQWAESCHTFSYANTNFVAAGTYTGRVTYTLSAP